MTLLKRVKWPTKENNDLHIDSLCRNHIFFLHFEPSSELVRREKLKTYYLFR